MYVCTDKQACLPLHVKFEIPAKLRVHCKSVMLSGSIQFFIK